MMICIAVLYQIWGVQKKAKDGRMDRFPVLVYLFVKSYLHPPRFERVLKKGYEIWFPTVVAERPQKLSRERNPIGLL